MSSANKNRILPCFITSGRSLIYRTKRIGPSTDPLGIPEVTFRGSDDTPFMITFYVRPSRKYSIHFDYTEPMLYSISLCTSLL